MIVFTACSLLLHPIPPDSCMKKSILLTLAATALAPFTHAQTTGTWSATPADGNWSNSSNWDTIPGATSGTTNGDSAVFNSSSVTTIVVDSGRNLQNITFGGSSTFTLSSSTLLLTSGGKILSNSSAVDQRISAPLQIQGGSGGTYTIETNTPGTNRELEISGAITGTATTGGTTTLTLTGNSGGANQITSAGGISNGSGGGNLAVVKEGSGLWVFGGANTYSGGTTVKGGTLRLSGSGNTSGLLGSGTLAFDGTGTLRLQSTTATTVNNAVNVASGGGTISNRTNNFFNPSSMTGTGTLTFTGDTGLTMTSNDMKDFSGTVRVVGAPSFNFRLGSTFVNNSLRNAAVQLESGANLTRQNGTNSTIVTDIGTLSGVAGSTVGGSAAGSGVFVYSVGGRNENSTFSGVIQNGGTPTGLTKVGTGSLTLTGTNTYTGATTVTAGSLIVTGSITASAVTVDTGGTLAGAGGSFGGLVTINGTHSPGASPGIQTFSGGLSYASSANLFWELAGNTEAGRGTNFDGIDVTGGTFSLDSAASINLGLSSVDFSNAFWSTARSWLVVDVSGTATAADSNVFALGTITGADPTGFGTFSVSRNSGDVVLNWTVIPEPGSFALVVFGAMTALRRRRRE